ncbi:MAG: iron-containing alcohol dehydrogenase [Actinomycetota bacterium]|nr:iron-containing alcohol dehydrogenase [Actinomycetota bacterium]
MIVRWGLEQLGPLLAELELDRPLVVASPRWNAIHLPPAAARWDEVPSDRVEAAAEQAAEAGGILAVGGGSAIDFGKAVSSETGLRLVSVPTTYAGAEWTPYFGIRDRDRRMKGGGSGARLAAAVYEPKLTLDLPRSETVGTAMNALAHCAEALYAKGHNREADAHALEGAHVIGEWLPRVVDEPTSLEARTRLLEGAMHAGAALGGSMLALGHAMAQALGGRYGLPHGALNAICLRAALRFNEPVAGDAIRRFGDALGAQDAVARVEELARLGGFERLRDLGVPAEELDEVATAVAQRQGAKANPREASPTQIAELLRSVW